MSGSNKRPGSPSLIQPPRSTLDHDLSTTDPLLLLSSTANPVATTSSSSSSTSNSNNNNNNSNSNSNSNSAYNLPLPAFGGSGSMGREGDVLVGDLSGLTGVGVGVGQGQGQGSFSATPTGSMILPPIGGEQEEKKQKAKGPPRTSRACLHCRKQKMRCEESQNPPCKRCRNAGVECVFERRSDYSLNPQDSAWQQNIEHRLTTLTSTVEAILSALEGRGIGVNITVGPGAGSVGGGSGAE